MIHIENLQSGFELGSVRVWPNRNVILRNGRERHVENRVMQTLVFLAAHAGDTVPRERFFDSVWQGRVVNEEALSRAISLLRSALGDKAARPEFIQTIPGVGYRLIAAVTPLAGPNAIAGSLTEPGLRPSASQGGRPRRWPAIALLGVLMLAVGVFILKSDRWHEASSTPSATGDNADMPTSVADGDAHYRSLAVLPFVNMSSNPEQDHLADGMTEELLNILANVPELRVTARTSSFFFKDRNLPVQQIAEILDVRHLLEGSVRRSGGTVRITAQLIDAKSDRHLWSQTYDRDEQDIFAIQDDVAAAIVSQLTDSIAGLKPRPTSRSSSLAAFEAYHNGRQLWWRRTPADFEDAIAHFEVTIEHDPNFAPAYAAIADSAMLLVLHGNLHLVEGERKAETYIEQALALDSESAEAYAALGLSRLTAGRKSEAEVALRKAITFDQHYIPAYLWLGALLGDHGRVIEQGTVLRAAMAMDPLNEMLAVYYAESLQVRGDVEGAQKSLHGLLRLQPEHPRLLVAMSEALLSGGFLVEAWQFARLAYENHPENVFVILAMAKVWMELGEFEQADAVWRAGLAINHRSVELKVHYLGLLMAARRAEDAERVMEDLFPADISTIAAGYQRTYHFFRGLLCELHGDLPGLRDHFTLVVDADERQHYDRDQVFVLTTAALINRSEGNPDAAEAQLLTAERAIGHARINGVNDADFYYSAASVFALRSDHERALQSLQLAYARGFRRDWLLAWDRRFDPLRGEAAFVDIQANVAADLEQARAEVRALSSTNP